MRTNLELGMNRVIKQRILPALVPAMPGAALAHPGHGVITNPVLHQITESVHLLPILTVLATALAVAWYRRRTRRAQSRSRRP